MLSISPSPSLSLANCTFMLLSTVISSVTGSALLPALSVNVVVKFVVTP